MIARSTLRPTRPAPENFRTEIANEIDGYSAKDLATAAPLATMPLVDLLATIANELAGDETGEEAIPTHSKIALVVDAHRAAVERLGERLADLGVFDEAKTELAALLPPTTMLRVLASCAADVMRHAALAHESERRIAIASDTRGEDKR